MKSRLLALVAATVLLTPGTALAAGKGHGKPEKTEKAEKVEKVAPATLLPAAEVTDETPVTEPAPEVPAPAPTVEEGPDYGELCAKESRKRVAGQKGTPFSRCVNALAKAGSGKAASPKAACKGLSKKRVKGQKGTPFSRCVVAASKVLEETTGEEPAPVEPVTEPAPVEPIAEPAPVTGEEL